MKHHKILLAALFFGSFSHLAAQTKGLDLNVFGYFQVSFEQQKAINLPRESNSFNLQQLNLFLQKDLAQRWTIFINFEFVNSYSSLRSWGAQNLEEAWARYRASEQFKLKLGLQVPPFNHLNEIKNKTPLLPYIIRPLVYESSFNEIIALDEFVPARAFAQVYGFIPARQLKFEYAVFIGDSPNINADPRRGQTGVDTTKRFLAGGRFGIRTNNLKLGVSATSDHLDFSQTALTLGHPIADFKQVQRLRLGGDFLLNLGKFVWESEVISVTYDDDYAGFDANKEFYYGTLGYHFTERLFAYGSYWVTHQNAFPIADADFKAPTAGVTYDLLDMIVIKAQYGRATLKSSRQNSQPVAMKDVADYYFLAVSVVF
jgi:hypothetical protein